MPRRTALVAIAALAVLALVATAFGVVQLVRANSERDSKRELADRLDDTEERVSDLEEQLEDAGSGPLDDLLEGLGDTNDLEGLLGDGGLEDLLGGGGAGLLECVGGGDLLGGGGSGSLDDLLGDIAGGGSGDPEGALEDLLGGLGGGDASSNAGARAQIKQIRKQVEDLRRLKFESNIDVNFMAPEALARRAARLFLEDYPAKVARAEARMLAALGAIPPETNLRTTMRDLLESQVAGFYVPETGKLFVPGAPDEPLTAIEKTIVAHELEHALADQRLDIPLESTPDPSEMDANLATLSLIEGDATLVMQRYSLRAIPVMEQLTMLSDPSYIESQQALEGMPPYLVEQLQFPYLDGLEFTCALEGKGGWSAVDRAYDNPPTTTAQVLFPERYRRNEGASDIPAPASPGTGWRSSFEGSFGAANLLWLFKAPGGDPNSALSDPEGRVAPWAGGEVKIWTRGSDTGLGLALAQKEDRTDLCDSVAEWYDASFDDDAEVATQENEVLARDGSLQDAVIWCTDDEVRLGIGPDLETARRIAAR